MDHSDFIAVGVERDLIHERSDQEQAAPRWLIEVHRLRGIVIEAANIEAWTFIGYDVFASVQRLMSSQVNASITVRIFKAPLLGQSVVAFRILLPQLGAQFKIAMVNGVAD